MGIFWRFAMPLLSTLAALVIIVHSAEEDLEQDYRYDLRPRALNTEPASYEQPWRVVKTSPETKHSSGNVWSQDSQEEPPKRRRKRKRRPIEVTEQDPAIQEGYAYREIPPKFNQDSDENVYQTTDKTRRRRKRINIKNNDEEERPIRRRGSRRNRPYNDPYPKLSEFPEQRHLPDIFESEEGDEHIYSDEEISRTTPGYIEYTEAANREPHSDAIINDVMIKKENLKPREREDESLSEFSMESVPSEENRKLSESVVKQRVLDIENKRQELHQLFNELKAEIEKLLEPENDRSEIPSGTLRIINNLMTNKNNKKSANIDDILLYDHNAAPLTLKDILKRSNGSSLSEILQHHNLTLSDLLHGKEKAITVLNKTRQDTRNRRKDIGSVAVADSEEKQPKEIEALESKNPLRRRVKDDDENTTSTSTPQEMRSEEIKVTEVNTDQVSREREQNTIKPNVVRYMHRFPTGMRKKLRLRPMLNNTYKSPLSRDMAALGLKRFPNRRNFTKQHVWKTMVPLMINAQPNNETLKSENDTDIVFTTTTAATTSLASFDDTTIVIDFDKPEPEVVTVVDETLSNVNDSYIEISSTDLTEEPITTTDYPTTMIHFNITEKPNVTPVVKQLNASGGRRNAFNNRLKRKRLKQKTSTTQAPTIKNTNMDDEEEIDALEDFITTVKSRYPESSTRPPKPLITSIRPTTTTKFNPPWRPTEETAEIEIEELLNDTRTSAKLSKILMERNMTLNELVEHRERGSSHVHLADIFHNASKEPNPPEPFLSKSLIEPISKETYPLRALLDANLHDPTVKATTIEPTVVQTHYIQNIPVVMDFGNNVNENAENMGIMSLFNESISTGGDHVDIQIPDNIAHETNGIAVQNTSVEHAQREGRMMNNNHDMISWNDIFSMIRKSQNNNETEHNESFREDNPSPTYKRITLEEDADGDGVIVLEDLQHLKDFDSNIASDEKLEIFEKEDRRKPSVVNITGNTKSVTVATASIVGLSMVLFLLTYAAFKWIQQKKRDKKRKFPCERIPTPVFENRKGHKNNSSTRSISPMLSTSNIYTMNTLESRNGKDSPEYMWDTLRKPFQ